MKVEAGDDHRRIAAILKRSTMLQESDFNRVLHYQPWRIAWPNSISQRLLLSALGHKNEGSRNINVTRTTQDIDFIDKRADFYFVVAGSNPAGIATYSADTTKATPH
jgi:hypothetical protein